MKTGMVKGIDKPISRLVMGTMIINSKEETRSFELLDAAQEFGWNALDTAYVYAGGDSERTIGKWMDARGNRDKVVILTKGAHPNADRKRVTSFDIAADMHDSLARLRTHVIDIYLLHRDNPELPVGPIVETLNEHYAAGRIRAFGGSNWTHVRIAQANEYAEKHGLVPFAASSPNYSLAAQLQSPWGPDCVTISGPANDRARAWYQKTGMPVFSWSSLARGFFSGRITRANFEQTKSSIDASSVRAYCYEENFERLDRAEQLAKEKGVAVPQIALAFVHAQPLNLFTCIGAASREEIEANAAAMEVRLTAAEVEWLDLKRPER